MSTALDLPASPATRGYADDPAVAYGINLGHTWAKAVMIHNGGEVVLEPFPSIIAQARSVTGAIAATERIELKGKHWYAGTDALIARGQIRTGFDQARLDDPHLLPVLTNAVMRRLAAQLAGGTASPASTDSQEDEDEVIAAGGEGSLALPPGYCVTGLPATWADDSAKGQALSQRLREGWRNFTKIRVIGEQLGLVYSVILGPDGEFLGDDDLRTQRLGILDLGGHTIDGCEIAAMNVDRDTLFTFNEGAAHPLQKVRLRLNAFFDADFSLYEVEQAIRVGHIQVGDQQRELPKHWDAPLIDAGHAITNRLGEVWGKGTQLYRIPIGGGTSQIAQITEPILKKYPQAFIVPEGQTAIARGFAYLARRFARKQVGA
jgi:hypothetical protein